MPRFLFLIHGLSTRPRILRSHRIRRSLYFRPFLQETQCKYAASCHVFAHSPTYSSDKIIEPYFPRHHERDTYVTLLQRTNPPASNALLKAALVRRAIADVQRILRLRDDKQALQNLLQKGSVGDDLWNSLLAAERELEAEIVEVHAEANSFVEGWGHLLFQTASEMLANEKTRAVVEQIPLERARNGINDACLTHVLKSD